MVDIFCSVLQTSVLISMFEQRKKEVGKYGSLFGSLLCFIFGGKRGCFFSLTNRSPLLYRSQAEPLVSVVEDDTGILVKGSYPK